MTPILGRLLAFTASAALLLAAALPAPAAESTPMADSGVLSVRRSTVFPAGTHFSGGLGDVVVDIDGKAVLCVVEFSKGCTIEKVKLRVGAGAELVIRDAWLSNCHIEAHPQATVLIVNSVLHECEVRGAENWIVPMPKMKFINCQLIESRFLSPVNVMGLQLQDCTVTKHRDTIDLRVDPGDDRAAAARDPLFRYTRFESCMLHHTAFLTAPNCSFKACTAVIGGDAAPPEPSAALVHVPVVWQGGAPAALPEIGGGVEFSPAPTTPISGSTLPVVWSNDRPAPAPEFLSYHAAVTSFPEFLQKDFATSSGRPSVTDLKRRQTHVNGLLVATLEGGKQAGAISKMNLTATPGTSSLNFNQSVGSDMSTALTEVGKFMQLRHGAMPEYLTLQIAFENKYSGKDGPSAAVACGLLVESAFTGVELDPAFAVTGDMNADGLVQPIGGVAAKMRGATRGACKIIAIPTRNESAIADLLVREGPAPLAAINVFGISKFDEALALASTGREGPLQEAVAEMEVIQQALQRDPKSMIAILRTPQAAARLQAVVTKAPNCLSAKYLLHYSRGTQPKFLTLAGSIEAADNDADALVAAIDSDLGTATNSLRQDELGGSLNRLRNLRPRLDQRVWPYVDGLVAYGEVLRGIVLNPIRSASRANDVKYQAQQTAGSVNSAKKQLLTDPAVREELGL